MICRCDVSVTVVGKLEILDWVELVELLVVVRMVEFVDRAGTINGRCLLVRRWSWVRCLGLIILWSNKHASQVVEIMVEYNKRCCWQVIVVEK